MVAAAASPWIAFNLPRRAARLRLLCLPCAGGSAMMFRRLATALPDWIEVCPVELPGRGLRGEEACIDDAAALVAALARGLAPLADRPYALFGHSMGAILAFEVARCAEREWARRPVAVAVSAMRAPHLPAGFRRMSTLPDAGLLDSVRALGGVPDSVWRDPSLCQMLVPLLRADFRVCDTYEPTPSGGALRCPILALAGARDPLATPAELAAWRQYSAPGFEHHTLPGGHFFIHDHLPALASHLVDHVTAAISNAEPSYA